ncbi:MAG: lycopene cyclase family protein [Gemmatimonadota bacterium]|nr:lycopene cyclase family protein [Gemmatimonadota bacterium]
MRRAAALDADLLIAGAGAAGLSCAVHLSRAGVTDKCRVLLLDPRTAWVHDRTWCFFDVASHPFEAQVSHEWAAWRVAAGDREVRRSCPGLRYGHLPSGAFYDAALARIAADPRIELRSGVEVEALEQDGDTVVARTSHGVVRGRLALDARPPVRRAGPPAGRDGRHARLLQHFHGMVIEAERDAFDPAEAVLMDFRVPQERGIHFMYVLPFDRRTALVEDTWFAGAPWRSEVYEAGIRAYLAERLGLERFAVRGGETGAIAMDSRPPAPPVAPRILPVGARAGAVRASTGYAFLAIQRHAAAVTERLTAWAGGQGGGDGGRDAAAPPPPPPPPYGRRTAFLDRVFLSHLLRRPAAAPELFLRLFEAVRPDALARFLFDGGGPADALRVMAALPAPPLVAEALRVHAGR